MSDSVILTKGESVNLTKKAPGLKKVFAAAGWDPSDSNKTMDLDLAVFALDANNKTVGGKDGFIYFGNKESADGSIKHSGDNLTGDGEGDDEQIGIDLEKLPTTVTKIAVVLAIYQAATKGQNLSDLKNSFVRVVNQADNAEIAKFEITAGMTGDSIMYGEFTRGTDNEWSFLAVGEAGTGEFAKFVEQYGLKAAA